ncbi:MAG: hypothetical protein FJ255_03020 [Phycisphaerae bacterium]|nr:hypothetical protein [Phycisphaerae bacterium]
MSAASEPPAPTERELALRAPVMTILSDHPILRDQADEKTGSAREGDSFELHTRLGAVYDIIRHQNTRAPLAIGIFGDWGTGKSSAMRWLADQLKVWSDQGDTCKPHFRTRCVWFEPWKYQTRDDVWRGLIAEVVINSIDPSKASVATVVNAVKKFGGALGRWFIHTVSSLQLSGGVPGVGEASVNLEALAKIAEDYKQSTHPERAFLNEFESTLKSWVKGSLGGDERMVLLIDDLDRCLPAVVLEVLEALKLYLNIPQLVFVIGLDRDVVKAVIRKQYRDAGLAEVKADSYLDKMFQVEVEVPPSEEQMDGYFEAQVKELDKATNNFWTGRLNAGGTGWKGIIEGAIRKIAEHNPREVKRLLNSTLMGGTAAVRKAAGDQDAAKRFGQGCQAYLIARALRDMDGNPAATLRLKETWTFLKKWSEFREVYKDYRPDRALAPDSKVPGERGPEKDDPQRKSAEEEVRRLMPCTRDIKREPFPLWDMSILWDLLAIECSPEVGQAVASRAAEAKAEPAPPPPGIAPASAPAPSGGGTAADAGADAVNRLPLIVRSRVAKHLGKDAKALTPSDLASVTALDLSGSDIKDEGLRELARAETGLKALTTLILFNTKVTDAGVKKLARVETGLKALTTLDLGATKVTDAGVKELARAETGLKALTALYLHDTQVTDEGVKELAREGRGLKALTTLDLAFTQVTDEGVKELARADTGLKALTTLILWNTQVTDAGVKELARAETGLKALTTLDLWNTKVTDAGVKELARAETGLKALTTLDLAGTQVTDAGVKELARAETGLKALTTLNLAGTKVTDAGVKELARAETGLKALTTLNLAATQVTDAGVKELARAETGLKALTTLNFGGTRVTDAGMAAVKARWPGITVIR